MSEIAIDEIKTFPLDHHEIVTAVCKDLRIAERVAGAPIKASDLSDYTLGHTLDEVAEYGVTDLFAKVAFGIALDYNLFGNLNQLDCHHF